LKQSTYISFIGLFLIFSLSSSASSARTKGFWSEKSPKAEPLVRVPSIQPIIEELDTTIVNISTSSEADKAPGRGPQGMPGDPFMNPEEFFERFFGPNPRQQRPRRSMGSGFIISADGYILTNNHVIEGADKIEVSLKKNSADRSQDNTTIEAKIIGRDPRTDVALIKIDPKYKLPFAYLGDSDRMKKGDWVVAMGNPFGLDHSVSIGIISAKGREISPNENRRFDDFIQTDAAINFGNSGGPLVNMKGEVIGINTAITAQGSGIGFAVPINMVKGIILQLKDRGKVQRGYLGVMIQDISEEMKDALGLRSTKGVLVNDVAPEGPAAGSALKPGDVIIRVDDEPTSDTRALQRIIGRKQPNTTVNLEVLRDSNRMRLSVRLGSLDEGQQQPIAARSNDETDRLGFVAKNHPEGGIEIDALDPNSPAAQAGVIPGDRIQQITYKSKKIQIRNVKDYRKLLNVLKTGESILLNVTRMQARDQSISMFVAFRVPPPKEKAPPKKKK
jgi:serine protease Do